MMSHSLLHAVVGATATSSLAILLVNALRIATRRMAGARAAYWLWLLVPASVLAVLLPAPSRSLQVVLDSLPGIAVTSLSSAVATVRVLGSSTGYVALVLAIWIVGVALMMAVLFAAREQRIADPRASAARMGSRITPAAEND